MVGTIAGRAAASVTAVRGAPPRPFSANPHLRGAVGSNLGGRARSRPVRRASFPGLPRSSAGTPGRSRTADKSALNPLVTGSSPVAGTTPLFLNDFAGVLATVGLNGEQRGEQRPNENRCPMVSRRVAAGYLWRLRISDATRRERPRPSQSRPRRRAAGPETRRSRARFGAPRRPPSYPRTADRRSVHR